MASKPQRGGAANLPNSNSDWFEPASSSKKYPTSTGPGVRRDVDIERADELPAGMLGKGVTSAMAQTFMDTAFRSARAQVGGWSTVLLNVEPLKPYFDVTTSDVLQRLYYSFYPKPAMVSDTLVALPDMYGPLMLVFTWAALLQFGMRLGHTDVNEGTLVGTSLGISFTYWIGASTLYWTIGYVLESQLKMIQILCITGYALSGYCVTLFVGCFIGSGPGILCLLASGGLCSAVLGMVFFYNTPVARKGIIAGGCIGAFHFLFLVYIKIFYASFYYHALAVMPTSEDAEPFS